MFRKLSWVLFVVFAVCAVPQVSFADATDELADKILQDKDAAQIKEQLSAFGKVLDLGEELQAKEPPLNEAKKESPKTLADVGDRALQLAEGMVTSTAATLEKFAPEVWRIMINQQYAKAMSALVVPVGLLFTALLWFLIMRKKWRLVWEKEEPFSAQKMHERSAGSTEKTTKTVTCRIGSEAKSLRMWIVNILPGVAMVGFGIWAAVAAKSVIMLLVNPEFYAIRDLVLLLLGKGQL